MVSKNDLPAALYRFYDHEGRLLYIGISLNPPIRFRDHRSNQPWYREVATITVEWLEDRPTALARELEAIRAELPLFNIQGLKVVVREVPDIPVVREIDAAVDNLEQAEQRLQRAIVEAAREAAVRGSKLTYAAIGRIAGYSREYVARQAAGAGIYQERANTKSQAHDPSSGT